MPPWKDGVTARACQSCGVVEERVSKSVNYKPTEGYYWVVTDMDRIIIAEYHSNQWWITGCAMPIKIKEIKGKVIEGEWK